MARVAPSSATVLTRRFFVGISRTGLEPPYKRARTPAESRTGLVLAAQRQQVHDHDDDRSKVVGSWLITHQDDPGGNPTKVTGVASFAEGGVLANQDINPIAPTGLGAWEGHGDNRFTGNFWAGTPGGGPEEPAVTLNVMIRGRVRGDMISGTYRFTVFAADGGDELASGTGTFEGERIEA